MNGPRETARTTRHFVATLLCAALVVLKAAATTPLHAQAPTAPPTLHRHHVIFLLDQSWSTIGTPEKVAEFRRVLREELEPLLRDSARNGIGVVYDSSRDVSSALAFGLFGRTPYFSERGDSGFFRVLWIEQPARHPTDLVERMPWTSTPYTGQESAFRLAIPAVRAELKPSEIGRGFEHTFLVKVTDDESNLPRSRRGNGGTDYFSEMMDIGAGAAEKYHVSEGSMDRDRQAAVSTIDNVERFYQIRPVGNGGAGISVGRGLVVLIRALVPHPLVGTDRLLAEGPEPEVKMTREAGRIYSTRLTVLPRASILADSAYAWVGAFFRAQATDSLQQLSLPAPGQPAVIPVTLPRAQISGARGELQLSFVRRDPVYGQAVQRVVIPLTFHAKPDRKIAGILPVADWMIPARFTQDQVADAVNVLLGALLLALLWVMLFPAPRAAVELAGFRGGDDGEPLVVDFTRERMSDEAGGTVLLGTLRLVNTARRGPFPRVERRFDVRVEVDLELPGEVTGTPPVVGLSDQMERVRVFRKVPHGSEQVMQLRLGALHDYAGDPGKPVDCRLTVRASQLRTGWLRRATRPAGSQLRRTLAIRFVPEAAAVQAALLGGTPPADGLPPRSLEHRRGARPLLPPFVLAARSTSSRACSLALDARIEATLFHLDRTAGSIPGAVEVGELEDELAEPGPKWVQDSEGAFYTRLQGIRARGDGGWAAIVPLWLNFEVIPLPGVVGDEYVLEVTVFAEGGDGAELWPTVTIRHPIRVEVDSRRPELLFQVSVSPRADAPAWRTFDRDADGAGLVLDVAEPLRWNVGNPENTVDFVALRIDNVARSGGGRVSLALVPPASVEMAPAAEKAFEPAYTRERRDILAIRGGGRSTGLGELAGGERWEVPNNASPNGRPIELFLSFRESALKSFDLRIRRFPYVCRLSFRCTIEGEGGARDDYPLTLQVNFAVQRYTGEHVLAIDFGTSATVAAFAASMDEAAMQEGKLPALLDLQTRYATVLRDRGVDSDGIACSEDEARFPNREAQTRFIPSQLVWRRGKKIGEPDFVDLPATAGRVMREFGRAVFYLKGLILDGRYELPEIQHYTEEGRIWLDERGAPHRDTPPPIDGVIRSAYRSLIGDFVEPELNHQAKHLDKVVFTHPNNFHLHHLDRVREILRAAFGERFDVHLLSESNAVALYCSYPPDRFDPGALSGSRCRKYLVYDIGAGTLDVTYTELKWGDDSEANRLREMEVLFKSGVPSGGNRLDIALARVLDAKLRLLERQLNEAQVGFRYTGKIVSPDREKPDAAKYPQQMLPVKLALMQLKEEASAPELLAKPFTLHVPVNASQDLQYAIVSVDDLHTPRVREILRRFDVEVQGPAGNLEILIPLSSDEIFTQPVVTEWLQSVTDEPIADLAHALKLRGLKPEIDCLVLSGRTSQFPPVRERLLTAIETHLGIPRKRLREAPLTPAERKAAVGLGALYFGLIHRHVQFVDRSIWARYGVVYQTGSGRRFQEFFSHATRPDASLGDHAVQRDGLSSVRLSRTHEITYAGGPASVVVTYSRDPDLDLKEPDALQNGRFVVVKPLGSDVLGTGLKVRITLGIDDQDRLTIGVDADGRHIEVDPRPVPMVVPVPPQWAWPFTPLNDPISLVAPPGKVPVPSLSPLPEPEPERAATRPSD